ncbi:DUF1515 domain-containing protein [Halorubrum sp. Atlit-8R]|uniref:DUF7310 family coiled-coil domain-containing protein n=1 Tax=unclassified Halorubrum TaxID=2642239 RepID=UPI000EF17B20|nr:MULTISPECIES: DUF1515 domain-containing protein [unclassified Halorubrum]RLM67442.1 DUF1515 domain-containing protein [Halorubrum sp. Atlit-9R]RLM77602.1 DUF1515 domain-containing protein [Halorubrum sp. Atlit-8R]
MTDHARGTEPPRAETEAESATPTDANGPNDRIESRLRAVERAVTGGDARPADAATEARATAERERLESRLDDVEERVAELEAATQAIRGYAGAVRAVNDEVERRADLALARATEASRGAGRNGVGGPDRDADEEASPDSAVPSERALDAALPDDGRASGPRTGDGGSVEGGGGASDDGGAWATDALDRLRESL